MLCCTGIILTRVTADAEKKLHIVSFSRFLAAEADLSVGAHIKAEKATPGIRTPGAKKKV